MHQDYAESLHQMFSKSEEPTTEELHLFFKESIGMIMEMQEALCSEDEKTQTKGLEMATQLQATLEGQMKTLSEKGEFNMDHLEKLAEADQEGLSVDEEKLAFELKESLASYLKELK